MHTHLEQEYKTPLSVNVPDVIDIYGIFEANETTDPQSPNAAISSMNGPSATTNDLIIGGDNYGQHQWIKG